MARNPSWLCGALALTLASGCALGPNYSRPAMETSAAWKTAVDSRYWKPAAPRDGEPLGDWWKLFGDPALTALEEQALEANQDIRRAMARVEEARAIARLSGADLVPVAMLNPSYDRFRRSSSGFGGSGSFYGKTFSVPFDLSYEVDLWGRVRRSFEAARADAEAGLAAQQFVLLSVTAEVARRYFELRRLEAETRILSRTLELRGDGLRIAQERASGGLVSDLDLERAKTELAAAEGELFAVQRQRAETENALAVLCGQNASGFKVAAEPLTAEMVPPEVPPGLPSELLERRPDVAEAERVLAAANARIGAAQAAFFPVLRLTGSGGWVSGELDSLFDSSSRVWSFTPSLSVPLFAGGRNTATVKAARARYDQSLAGYRQQVLAAFADVENALSGLQWLGRQAQAQTDAVAAARNAAALSNSRYEQGLSSYLESVDAERQRLQAERGAVQVASDRLISTVLLIKALGGAWEQTLE